MFGLWKKLQLSFQNKTHYEQDADESSLWSVDFIPQNFTSETNELELIRLHKLLDANCSISPITDKNFFLDNSSCFEEPWITSKIAFSNLKNSDVVIPNIRLNDQKSYNSYFSHFEERIDKYSRDIDDYYSEVTLFQKPSIPHTDFRELTRWERLQALVNEVAGALESLYTETQYFDIKDDAQRLLRDKFFFIRHRYRKLTKAINRILRKFFSLLKSSRDLRTEIRTKINVIFKNMDDEAHILIG